MAQRRGQCRGRGADCRRLEIGEPVGGGVDRQDGRWRGRPACILAARHLDDIEVRGGVAETIGQRTVPGTPGPRVVAADQQARQVVFARIIDQRGDRILRRARRGGGAERAGQFQGAHDALAPGFRVRGAAGGLDMDRVPGRLQAAGEAGAGAHQPFRTRAGADADQQRIARLPHRLRRNLAAVGQHLLIDAVGGAAQCQLAQRDQVALAEKVADRPLSLQRQVDLAFLEALQQLVGRQVHEHHLVGGVEDMVRHRFPDADAGDAADHVVERFEVLHIHGGIDVDAGLEQLVHILPALRVAGAGDVRMRQFVHQDQGGLSGQRGVEVEFLQHLAAIGNLARRQAFEADGERLGLLAAVGFDHADDDIDAQLFLPLRGGEHRIGLADAGRGAEEDFQLAARGAGFLFLHADEEGVGIGTGIACHVCPASSARFSLSTLIRGSPRIPRSRPSVWRAIACRTSAASIPRALATRSAW